MPRSRVVPAAASADHLRGTAAVALRLLLAGALGLTVAGCAGLGGLTKARVEIRCGTNVVSLVQPKDTVVRRLEFDPERGVLVLEGYTSSANASAIEAAKAQAEAQQAGVTRTLEALEWAFKAGARSQGINLSDPQAAAAQPAVASRKWKLVPSDDPGTGPKPEVLTPQ